VLIGLGLDAVAARGDLASINAAVDALNAISLHSGLPMSVIDLDRAAPPFSIRTALAGEAYVFNVSGQSIDIAGLPCLYDARAPAPTRSRIRSARRPRLARAAR
jgi:DNA/RNA-binding domain of Phe-tRNA-synthetase-like protein